MNQVVTLLLMGGLQTSKCVYAPMDKVAKLSAFHAGDASSNLAGSTNLKIKPRGNATADSSTTNRRIKRNIELVYQDP